MVDLYKPEVNNTGAPTLCKTFYTGFQSMTIQEKLANAIISPCGIYCGACPRYRDTAVCRGCRCDGRHDKCDIYECCVVMGGKDFCYECDCFPCERLINFTRYNPGKSFAHFRHIAIENLNRIRLIGPGEWAREMEIRCAAGEYTISGKNRNGDLDTSPCPCETGTK